MGLVHIFERGGSELHEYKKALMNAKKSIETLCDLTDEMEDEYGYGERSGYRRREDEMDMRMGRRSMR